MVEGKVHRFRGRGVYNGMSLIYDENSGSYWDHITGQCLYGPLAGYQLASDVLLPLTVSQAYKTFPHLGVAFSDLAFHQRLTGNIIFRWARKMITPWLNKLSDQEDTRLPRFELGLGVWEGDEARFYRISQIREANRVFIDTFCQRSLVVYIEGDNIPAAFYTIASAARWADGLLHFDNETFWRDGWLYNDEGKLQMMVRPMQMYTRWFGFAYTFPQCDIYDSGS